MFGSRQKTGVKKLWSRDVKTKSDRLECVSACLNVSDSTGCEAIWGRENRYERLSIFELEVI